MTGPVTVTQEARDIVWLICNARQRKTFDQLAGGVQAIIDDAMRAAGERGARIALEAAAKVAEIMGSEWNPERSKFDAVRHDEAHGIATAIRQTDPAQIVKGQSDG
jgi:tRNA G26 N,N-dimethylase Trm1